jgi:hypothetical protein
MVCELVCIQFVYNEGEVSFVCVDFPALASGLVRILRCNNRFALIS